MSRSEKKIKEERHMRVILNGKNVIVPRESLFIQLQKMTTTMIIYHVNFNIIHCLYAT